jgi:hypothetical protein
MRRRDEEDDELVEVNMVYTGRTPMAIFAEDENGKSHTLPRSQIRLDPLDPDRQENVTISMPEWLAIDRGLV